MSLLIRTNNGGILNQSRIADSLRHLAEALEEASRHLVVLRRSVLEIASSIKECKSLEQQKTETEQQISINSDISLLEKSHVSTNIAAAILNRNPQTLRKWACYENGPIRPIRINGRLAWPTEELRKLLTQ